ncbi:hypothetical protein ACHAWT_003354 [Skeletonema menzelii]
MSIPYNTAFIIPTKVGDNCSYSESLMKQVTGQEKSEMDAFQYYSSDFLRLKTLLIGSDEDGDDLNALATVNNALRSAGLSGHTAGRISVSEDKDTSTSKRRRGNKSQSIKQKESGTSRKTRLSWELHPNLLLHDLYDSVGEDIQSVSDDEDSLIDASSSETASIKN